MYNQGREHRNRRNQSSSHRSLQGRLGKDSSPWAGEEPLSRARGGCVCMCMHDPIDSICVPAQKVGRNGGMSRWRQASVGRQAGRPGSG